MNFIAERVFSGMEFLCFCQRFPSADQLKCAVWDLIWCRCEDKNVRKIRSFTLLCSRLKLGFVKRLKKSAFAFGLLRGTLLFILVEL